MLPAWTLHMHVSCIFFIHVRTLTILYYVGVSHECMYGLNTKKIQVTVSSIKLKLGGHVLSQGS